MTKRLRLLAACALAVLFLLAAFVPLNARVAVINSASIAADTNFTGVEWPGGATEADLFYRIDHDDTATNTTSLELEVSPDGVNWYDDPVSPTLLTANAADANGIVQDIPIHGWQFRLVANTTNTNTITPALTVVIR